MLGSEAAAGDGLSSSLAGMSKNQLYDIMSQMKALIEQNQQQARQILIQNPLLTRALFQAQIMLGMVHPPQAIPNIQPTASQTPAQPAKQTNIQAPQSLPKQSDVHEQISPSQTSAPIRKQHQMPPMIPLPSTSAPPMNLPPPPLPSHALQSAHNSKNTANSQVPQMSLPQSSQLHHNIPHQIQPHMPMSSSQLQQPLPPSGIPHMLMQPPLPPQPRPPTMPTFSHQPQMGPNTGFQHPGAPQLHHSQPMFHPSMKQPGMGPPYPQGQPPRLSQTPSHPMYQVGNPHLNTEFGNQAGNSMQPERGGGSTWIPGLPDNNMAPPPPIPSLGPSSQMSQPNQPPRPAPLTPEMEQALLQQVMSLTQEQINLLPPEQRNQVLQLQQMLRQ